MEAEPPSETWYFIKNQAMDKVESKKVAAR
jgi:hypothetical protein